MYEGVLVYFLTISSVRQYSWDKCFLMSHFSCSVSFLCGCMSKKFQLSHAVVKMVWNLVTWRGSLREQEFPLLVVLRTRVVYLCSNLFHLPVLLCLQKFLWNFRQFQFTLLKIWSSIHVEDILCGVTVVLYRWVRHSQNLTLAFTCSCSDFRRLEK